MVAQISVVVSTYRGAAHLPGCLEMLERQTAAARMQIIVVDSGSPDDERSIVERYQVAHDNITYVRTERESLYAAWNRALAMAEGSYFANVNVDDWIRDDALELFAAALDRHSDGAIAFAHWAMTTVARGAPTDADLVAFHAPYEPAMPLFYSYGGSTQFWRRSALVALGGFDASFQACGDLEVLVRLAAAGGCAVLVPQVLEGYFHNPGGISQSSDVAPREQAAILADARATMPLGRLFCVDDDDPSSVAAGWVALGNMAVDVRVPWHEGKLGEINFALECYERALSIVPGESVALHNRYAVLFDAGRFDEAERSLADVPATRAALARGAEFALIQPRVVPAVAGPVFDDVSGIGPWADARLTGTRPDRVDPVATELAGAKEYIASLEWHLEAERAETDKLRRALRP